MDIYINALQLNLFQSCYKRPKNTNLCLKTISIMLHILDDENRYFSEYVTFVLYRNHVNMIGRTKTPRRIRAITDIEKWGFDFDNYNVQIHEVVNNQGNLTKLF